MITCISQSWGLFGQLHFSRIKNSIGKAHCHHLVPIVPEQFSFIHSGLYLLIPWLQAQLFKSIYTAFFLSLNHLLSKQENCSSSFHHLHTDQQTSSSSRTNYYRACVKIYLSRCISLGFFHTAANFHKTGKKCVSLFLLLFNMCLKLTNWFKNYGSRKFGKAKV